jgi:hypothetical protein
MSTLSKALSGALAAIVAVGCARTQSDATKSDSTKADTNTAAAGSAAAGGAAAGSSLTLATFDGIGRARIGASAAQLREVGAVPPAGADAACRIVALDWMPAGTRVMLIRDTVARVEVDSTSTVRTIDGAAVGDPEARILQLYPNARTQPHKYVTNGHYMSVASPNDSTRRLVFETDGATVKRYRVGRQPEVDFVESCG